MISFIIPIIHPLHPGITSYNDVLICLMRTLEALLNSEEVRKIIVVAHKIPTWFQKKYMSVHFIIVNSKLFTFLKDLDGLAGTNEQDKLTNSLVREIPYKYETYLNMKGLYHNKDKGLKYFIGLLYLFNLKNTTKFVCLMDGDDFVINNLGSIINKSSQSIDMYVVQYGYIMFSNSLGTLGSPLEIDSIYRLQHFSNVCGSNRIFRCQRLQEMLKYRLRYNIPQNLMGVLSHKRQANDKLVNYIMANVDMKPEAWTILPNFFGVHRIFLNDKFSHPHHFMKMFTIKEIPIRSAIKFIHSNNHSCQDIANTSLKDDIITRYKYSGFISNSDNGKCQKKDIITNFGINKYYWAGD